MRGTASLVVFVALVALGTRASAGGTTQTLPRGGWLLDVAFHRSNLSHRYDDNGDLQPLLPEIDRHEPGGGYQGTVIPNAEVEYGVLATQVQYGILDNLSIGFGIPVVLNTTISPDLDWREGDYQQSVGRPYSERDFWEWAESLGQPQPGYWSGNNGVLGDILLGARWRFSDHISAFRESEWAMAFSVIGALPTGRPSNPEEVVAAGTTSWDLHSMGELSLHFAVDRFFSEHLDGRLAMSLDIFCEFLFRHEYDTPEGEQNPLLLNYSPYVGETYTIDPGDFWGGLLQIEVVPLRGPAGPTRLNGGDPERAAQLPPMTSFFVRYTHLRVGRSDWESDSEIWNRRFEQNWDTGYKNILMFQLTVSLLRIGAPLQLYARYRNRTWLPGRNTRAADSWTIGLQVPAKFW